MKDVTGKIFGKLTAMHVSRYKKDWGFWWKCKCACGKETDVRVGSLLNGHTKSCGCGVAEAATTHGFRSRKFPDPFKAKVWTAWNSMKQRCDNPKNCNYRHYGARGIKYCELWRHDFERFFDDIGLPPTLKHSLGRRENNSDYSATNCRWEDSIQQQRNRRNNRVITINGIPKCAQEWCEIVGISSEAFIARVERGWSDEELLSPRDQFRKRFIA
jgi:hypothetical protein